MSRLTRPERIAIIEARLRRMRPIWQCCHRALYLSNDGIYIVRGNDDGAWFYYAITERTGDGTNLLGGQFGLNEYAIVLFVFQKANLPGALTALGRWFNARQSR
jgi:hypothetical protein